jgi:excisionase family DNA binding protein
MSQDRFTTNETAARLGVTPARVRQMIIKGEIESEKFGRDRVISAKALKAAMNRKTKPGPAPRIEEATATTKKAISESKR